MAADTMEALGLKGQYVVKVNNRKVLDGVLDSLGIAPDKRLTAMRAIDKLAEFMREYPERKVSIEGHTDSIGTSP